MIKKIADGHYEFTKDAITFTATFLPGFLFFCGTVGQQIFKTPDGTTLEDLPRLFPTNHKIIDAATLHTETIISRKKYVDEVDRSYREKLIDDHTRLALLDLFYLCKCSSMVLKQRLKEANLYKWTEHMNFEELQPALIAHIGAMQLLIREIASEDYKNSAE
jgi:hypothetical protein